MATLAFASHWQVPPLMPEVEWMSPDKVVHFSVYGLLATLWLRFFSAQRASRQALLWAWLATVGFGLADELVQAFNPVRTFDPADLVADATGALVALAASALWPAYRAVLEASLWPRRRRPGPPPDPASSPS